VILERERERRRRRRRISASLGGEFVE